MKTKNISTYMHKNVVSDQAQAKDYTQKSVDSNLIVKGQLVKPFPKLWSSPNRMSNTQNQYPASIGAFSEKNGNNYNSIHTTHHMKSAASFP